MSISKLENNDSVTRRGWHHSGIGPFMSERSGCEHKKLTCFQPDGTIICLRENITQSCAKNHHVHTWHRINFFVQKIFLASRSRAYFCTHNP
jgi:hypothetical protein